MKPLLFIVFLLFLFLPGKSQQYIYVPCSTVGPGLYQDSLLVAAGDENFSFERLRFCNMGHMYDYETGLDTISDSLLQHVHKILEPYFGKWTSRVEVLSLRNYNQYKNQPDKKTAKAYPYCIRVKYDFLCRLDFDDSLFYSFSVQTDADGEILNKEDIPHGLDTLIQFRLIPPCEIYHKAQADTFFTGAPPREVFRLQYSEKKQVLYYEVVRMFSDTTGLSKQNTPGTEVYDLRFIFYNAVTGEVTWRALATCKRERGPDWETDETDFPENELLNTR